MAMYIRLEIFLGVRGRSFAVPRFSSRPTCNAELLKEGKYDKLYGRHYVVITRSCELLVSLAEASGKWMH